MDKNQIFVLGVIVGFAIGIIVGSAMAVLFVNGSL